MVPITTQIIGVPQLTRIELGKKETLHIDDEADPFQGTRLCQSQVLADRTHLSVGSQDNVDQSNHLFG